MTDNLIVAGNIITDEELILYILGGLGSKYNPVVINLQLEPPYQHLKKFTGEDRTKEEVQEEEPEAEQAILEVIIQNQLANFVTSMATQLTCVFADLTKILPQENSPESSNNHAAYLVEQGNRNEHA